MTILKTIPTRKSPATTTTMKGLITALALSNGVLAAGTNTRQVGLYAGDGCGDVIGVFTMPDDDGSDSGGGGGGEGGGITQLLWSVCGRYLYIVERKSNVVSVYDIRGNRLRVESFHGRKARTNQRIGVDVATGLSGEVIGGGTDGVVKIWEASHGQAGKSPPECVGNWQAHEDVVTSALVHPSGSVVATCSGSRKTFGLEASDYSSGSDSEDANKGLWDNSLKIWDISGPRRDLDP